ncbi:predicted protein [Aspergillus nidulans FGSC A4]|uniref:Uncharacterized protein n=1 Tax=Emericella nidulans (strain FGSC A4 / ATCC 38163 / CBS 112.46 / NRRL 194 / M139) TaxID=227321 RepID=Q5B6Y6_EMENI|nr:hypothetical protein [Aspergillus nidulans FGSC A4]EAA59902.1 predicted protein [Aspergillus nidulans FGSC A4]CBF75593.1 TPA: conserved hypothetical protein [Aspergillus nidulans FGSC A4]|eukprot:XP_661298.1 predicted protein [Aspergillus nidulans FGSC A4]
MDPNPTPDQLPSLSTTTNKAVLADDAEASSSKDIPNPLTVDNRAVPLDEEGPLSPNNISNRLTQLARLSTLRGSHANRFSAEAQSINQCLNQLEFLLNPRSNVQLNMTQGVASNQQTQNQRGRSPGSDPGPDPGASRRPDGLRGPAASSNSMAHSHARSLGELSTAQLTQPARTLFETPKVYNLVKEFDEEMQRLSDAFLKRREETFYIYSLHDKERKRMRCRIAELEAEIEELQADMQQEMAEREALQGTVRGFETWIERYQEEYQLAHKKKPAETPRQKGRGWWSKQKVCQPGDFDVDALFDGITAWMRGWADVEEEFRNRETARRQRRIGKNKQRQDITNIQRESSTND